MRRSTSLSYIILSWFLCFCIVLISQQFYQKADASESTGLANSIWPCYMHDTKRTGQSPYEGVHTNALKWSYSTGGFTSATMPVVGSDGTIYFGSWLSTLYGIWVPASVYALNPDGSEKWTRGTDDACWGSPVIGADGTLYFIGGSNIHALNPEDGSTRWSTLIGAYCSRGSATQAAVGADGTIYVGNNSGYVYALDPNGNIQWAQAPASFTDPNTPYVCPISSIAIDDDGILYCVASGSLYALYPDGNLKWDYQPGYGAFNPFPAIGNDGTIYVGNDMEEKFYAINNDGSLKWSYQIDSNALTTQAIASDGTIYVGGDDSHIHALNPDGSLQWKYQLDSGILPSSIILGADGTIYIGSNSDIYALNPDGSLQWTHPLGGRVAAIDADGALYIWSYNIHVFGIDTQDTEPPEILCPKDMTVSARGVLTRVLYSATIIDNVYANPIITYDPEPGWEFPLGTTEVTLTATDFSGNSSICTFNVTVQEGPIGLAESAWPCLGHDSRRTGRSPYIGAQANTLKWYYQTEEEIYGSSPAIGLDGTIYIGSYDHYVYALNPEDGSLKWRFQTNNRVSSTPAIRGDGTIYVINWSGKLYALSPEDGTQRWASTIKYFEYLSPAIGADGMLYIIGALGELMVYALKPEDGSIQWSYQTESRINSSPTIGTDGSLYVGCVDGKVYALNPQDGSLIWSNQIGGRSGTPAIADDGTIYIGSDDHYLYALNPEDGSQQWRYETGDEIVSSPAIAADGTIVVGNENGTIYALDPDGDLKWSYQTTGRIASPAIGADGTIYIGDRRNILALTPEGSLKWSYNIRGDTYSPVIGADGTVYFGSEEGMIYAFGPVADRPLIFSVTPTGVNYQEAPITISGENFLDVAHVSLMGVTVLGSYIDEIPAFQAGKLFVDGDYAYLAAGEEGLWILDISDKTQPFEVGRYNPPSGHVTDVYVSGTYAYLADSEGLRVVDITDKASPIEEGFYNEITNMTEIHVSGDYAFVTAGWKGLRVIDISDPKNISEAGFYDTPGSAGDLSISGSYAYVADYDKGLRILDITDPVPPLEVGDVAYSEAEDVCVSGDYAYVASGSDGLRIINIADKEYPKEVGFYNHSDFSSDVLYLSGDYAYVEYEYNTLGIIDISNKTRPVKVGSYDITFDPYEDPFYHIYDIYVSEGYIFLVVIDWTEDPVIGGLVIAQLIQEESVDVSILDPQTITATVTDSLPDGMYDVVVENTAGRRERLSEGFMIDTTPPEIICPSNITKYFPSDIKEFTVNIPYQVTDNLDPLPKVTKDPTELNPGFGKTAMTLTATDHLGNTSQCSFTITIKAYTPQPLPYPGLSQAGMLFPGYGMFPYYQIYGLGFGRDGVYRPPVSIPSINILEPLSYGELTYPFQGIGWTSWYPWNIPRYDGLLMYPYQIGLPMLPPINPWTGPVYPLYTFYPQSGK